MSLSENSKALESAGVLLMSADPTVIGQESKVTQTVTVTVNRHAVTFHERKTTGLLIKKTAISQGVPIQLDFNLFEVKGPGKLKQIVDHETVELHKGEVFRAVTPDDNS